MDEITVSPSFQQDYDEVALYDTTGENGGPGTLRAKWNKLPTEFPVGRFWLMGRKGTRLEVILPPFFPR